MTSSQDGSTRKLAAIMFTDIKAFSWKMATNEIASMEILKTHDNMMKESIEKHGGRVIKSIGDSFMVDFPSAVNAVSCALELQHRFWEHNRGKAEFDKIEVRMGLHLGDVIDVGNDMYGDGVNIASRVEAITEPNRICITQDIYSQIKKKMNLNVFSIGPMKFKNIDEPVEVYEILIDDIPELSTPSQTAKQAPSRKAAEKTAKREAQEAESVEAKKQKLEEEEERQKKIQALYKKVEEAFHKGQLDEAEKEIQEIYRLVPIHYGAQMIMTQIEEERFRQAEERRRKIESERRAMQEKTEKIESLKQKIQSHVGRDEYPEGLEVVKEIFAVDPDNTDAKALQERLQQLQREKEEHERVAAEEAQRILQTTLEKRAEQAKAAVEQKVEVVEKPQFNKKLILQVGGGVAALALLILLGLLIKNTFFPNTASLAVIAMGDSSESSTDGSLSSALASLLAEDFARQEHVFVISPTSALNDSKSGKTKQEIAADLNVKQLILIKAKKTSEELSVDAELFDVEHQTMWTGTLKGDNFLQASNIRKQIVSTVLEQLDIRSEIGEFPSSTKNSDAYQQYLIGLSLIKQQSASVIQQGMDYLSTALQVDSTFALAHAARAQAVVQLFKLGGETNKAYLNTALRDLQSATERNNQSALAYQVLGEVSRYHQRFDDAKEALAKSLALQHGNAACYRQLALIALTEAAYDQATEHSNRALSLDPKNPETLVTAGLVAHFKKEYDNALKLYDVGISLGANDSLVTVRYRLSVWASLEMRQEAEDYCKKLLERAPNDYRTNYLVGRALQQRGQWDESKPYLEQALLIAEKAREANPNDISLLGSITVIKSRLAKLDEAQKEIELAIQLHGSSPEILYRRANVYAIQGQQGREKVFNALKEAVAAEFNFAEILNPDFIAIQKEPEFAHAIVRKVASQ